MAGLNPCPVECPVHASSWRREMAYRDALETMYKFAIRYEWAPDRVMKEVEALLSYKQGQPWVGR